MPFDLNTLNDTLWLAEPAALRRLVAQVLRVPGCPTGRALAKRRRSLMDDAKQTATKAVRSAKGRIGVIPIYGPVDQRYTSQIEKAGGTPLEYVSAAFDNLMADSSISAIVLDIDSPGGSSYGVEELSDKIFAGRSSKKIYAVANSMACSAAFWIASAAEIFCCTPGGDVGSVGVYCMHVDESQAMADEGLTVTLISAGRFKTECASTTPLSADARDYLQASVDETYAKFIAAVARNRGVPPADVRAKYGQGRVLSADAALAAGMIDKVMTCDELLARLTGGSTATSAKGTATLTQLRLRHEHRKRLTAGAHK